ncbi:uncharacterized protein A4U43_C08F24510 [Asparagus officinalis]|nr:uncharacterized protein A4U43_C08F24510 [Asparagus officinalis]
MVKFIHSEIRCEVQSKKSLARLRVRFLVKGEKSSAKFGEGLYGVKVIGLHMGFIHEDAPVNEVIAVPNLFGNELSKTDARYPDGDTRFLS